MNKKWLVALLLAVGGGPALAEWLKIAQTGQSAFYLEMPLPKKAGGHVMAWVLRDHAGLQYGPSGPYLSSKDQIEVDCPGGRVRRLYSSDHPLAMGKGRQIRFEHGPMSWNHASPNTVLRQIVDVACAQP